MSKKGLCVLLAGVLACAMTSPALACLPDTRAFYKVQQAGEEGRKAPRTQCAKELTRSGIALQNAQPSGDRERSTARRVRLDASNLRTSVHEPSTSEQMRRSERTRDTPDKGASAAGSTRAFGATRLGINDFDATVNITSEDGQYVYNKNSAGTEAAVRQYLGDMPADGVLKIPDTIDGLSVTLIGPTMKFDKLYTPFSVELPFGVQAIADRGFASCKLMRSIVIPDSVTSIGESAFSNCTDLVTVDVPGGVLQIPTEAFMGCSNLSSITIAAGVQSIGEGAFEGCSLLSSIVLPTSITQIGRRAFRDCSGLTRATINGEVTSIPEYAFAGCANLAELTLPGSVESIEPDAFRDCEGLRSLTFPSDLRTIGNSAFSGAGLTRVVLPEGCTTIGDYAFRAMSSLESVVLPKTITTIGESAFQSSSNLKTVTVEADFANPAALHIANSAFTDMSSETNVVFAGTADAWESAAGPVSVYNQHIWCQKDHRLLGLIDEGIFLNGPGTDVPVWKGQTVSLTVTTDIMPPNASLSVQISAAGASPRTQNIVLEASSARAAQSVDFTVDADPEGSVRIEVTDVGGNEYSGSSGHGEGLWTATVSEDPVITVAAAPQGNVEPGDTVTLTISGTNVPVEGLTAALQLSGLKDSSTGSSQQSITLTPSDLPRKITCTVDTTGNTAQAALTSLTTTDGAMSFSPPAPISFAVTQTQAPTPSPSSGNPLQPSSSPAAAPSSAAGQTSQPSGTSGQAPELTIPPSGQSAEPSGAVGHTSQQPGPSLGQSITSSGTSGQTSALPSTAGSGHQTPTAPVYPAPHPTSLPSVDAASGAQPTSSASASMESANPSIPDSASHLNPVSLVTSAPDMPADLAVVPVSGGTGTALAGVEIGTLWNASPADLIAAWIQQPSQGDRVRVVSLNGEPVALDDQVATGMKVEVLASNGTVIQQSAIVVMGDVVGSGEISLTQLVRMAQAYVGARPLHGVFAMAADVNRDKQFNLTDLTKEAELYLKGSLNVDCVITNDTNPAQVLQTAGYTMEPWTDNLAVLTADIPHGADISSVAWTQHDFFPDGREQELYYEGAERALVFGAYTEGRTTITAVVTTASGKQGTRQTDITWGSDEDAEVLAGRSAATVRIVHADDMSQIAVQQDTAGRSSKEFSARASGRPNAGATRPRPTAGASTSGTPKPTASAAASAKPSPSPSGTPSATGLLKSFQAQILKGTNALRSDNQVKPTLRQSRKLCEAAQVRASEMAAAGKLSHTRPDGSKYDTVAELDPSTVIGENIHCNKGYPLLDTALVAEQSWENSAPHRANMLVPQYAYIGTGFAQAADGMWYCVQVFSNGDKVLSIDKPRDAK